MNEDKKNWNVLTGEFDGKPIITSYRNDVDKLIQNHKYSFQIGVAIPLLRPDAKGLPERDEAEILWKIEDRLSVEMEETHNIIYVMSISTQNMREFVFYAPQWKPKEYEETIREIEKNLDSGHKIQFLMQEDSNWETYKKFANQRS